MKQESSKSNDWELFRPYFKQMVVPPRSILLQEGKVATKMYFIEKGCLRTWVNNDGKEITTQFFFEGDRISSIESFRTNRPSLYSIETIEGCVLQTITQNEFQMIVDQSPEIKKYFEEHLFKRLFQAQQLFFSFLKNSPQQRYEELVARYPHIVQRVPQHYIASYLGITSVSLSRIRNRR
jgi:CRP-like cAMP-binding protein